MGSGSLGSGATVGSAGQGSGWEVVGHAGLATIAPAWRAVEAQGRTLAFQRLGWVEAWWRTMAPDLPVTPLFIEVRHDGRPVMVLPLCVRRELGLRLLEFIDGGATDYHAPALAADLPDIPPGFAEDLFGRILAVAPPVDVVSLRNVPTHVAGRPNPLLPGGAAPQALPGYRMRLADFPACTRGVMSQAERKLRRLRRQHGVELTAQREDAEALDSLFRWKGRQYPGCLLDRPHGRAFYRALMEAGLATLYALRIDGRTAAVAYLVEGGGDVVELLLGFDPEQAKLSPGGALRVHMMQCLKEAGVATLDSGIGDEPYKADCGDGWQTLYAWRRPVTPLGSVCLGAWGTARAAWHGVRRLASRQGGGQGGGQGRAMKKARPMRPGLSSWWSQGGSNP